MTGLTMEKSRFDILTIIIVFSGTALTKVISWEVWRSTCYSYSTNQLGYSSASDECVNCYGKLVEVETMDEFTELKRHMESGHDYWAGVQKDNNDDYYWEVGGGPVFSGLWESGAPDHFDQCARFRSSGNHYLNDRGCSSTYRYICEKQEDFHIEYYCVNRKVNGNNIALGGVTHQSSEYNDTVGMSALAVDGDVGACARTQSGTNVWWQVDLQEHYIINSVKIIKDCCDNYSLQLDIRLYSKNPSIYGGDATYTTCSIVTTNQLELTISCNQNTVGRWFRVITSHTQLVLCEVEIYGVVCSIQRESSTCTIPQVVYNISDSDDYTTEIYQTTSTVMTTEGTTLHHTTEATTQAEDTTTIPTTASESTTVHHATSSAATSSTDKFDTTLIQTTNNVENISLTTLSNTDIVNYDSASNCYCPCNHARSSNMSEEELNQQIQQIINELKVETKSTSSYLRTLVSADDKRPSSKGVGSVGIALLIIVFLFLTSGDIFTVVSFIFAKCFKRL